jgi:tRNA dimethylallyltransferase
MTANERSDRPVAALDPSRAVAAETILAPSEGELIVIVGPTATGKTALAIDLARRFDGEIVSADSVQIYREFELGTGKPSEAELAARPHHLLSMVDPREPVDAARYAALADEAIASIRSRGRVPIVCGGTFLWVKGLVRGLAPTPGADVAIRARHAETAARDGRAALHALLAEVDAPSAARLAPNDFVRVSRALEVFELSGRPLSEWHAKHAFGTARHEVRTFGVARAAEDLDARIAERVAFWLAAGWVREVAALRDRGFGETRAMGAVGFKQIALSLEGKLPEAELEVAIVRATRVFARRQRTWLRDEAVTWVLP